MSLYKYLAQDEAEQEQERAIENARTEAEAIEIARTDDEAIIDGETGEPFVYVENPSPSRFGCGGDCCNGWILVSPKELRSK